MMGDGGVVTTPQVEEEELGLCHSHLDDDSQRSWRSMAWDIIYYPGEPVVEVVLTIHNDGIDGCLLLGISFVS